MEEAKSLLFLYNCGGQGVSRRDSSKVGHQPAGPSEDHCLGVLPPRSRDRLWSETLGKNVNDAKPRTQTREEQGFASLPTEQDDRGSGMALKDSSITVKAVGAAFAKHEATLETLSVDSPNTVVATSIIARAEQGGFGKLRQLLIPDPSNLLALMIKKALSVSRRHGHSLSPVDVTSPEDRLSTPRHIATRSGFTLTLPSFKGMS
mmetsp:Transcript_6577/g.10399  ORF Transcript_6577/g.10399 Transcript_6577/m.10399 type:complete len:205 (-) Transcript_6577:444-1058(-)